MRTPPTSSMIPEPQIPVGVRSTPSSSDQRSSPTTWNLGSISGPTVDSLYYFARTAPWFFWPAWPVALWAAWRWRGRWGEPAVALPMLTAGALALRETGIECRLAPAGAPVQGGVAIDLTDPATRMEKLAWLVSALERFVLRAR